MRHVRLAVILLAALVVSAAVLMPSTAPVFGVTVVTAAQDAAAVEAALGLDRPTRRLIQQGLRSEGFDPGTPDGLFGPRTRAAIRAWQAARNEPQTGYLDGDQVAALRGATVPRPVTASPESRDPALASAPSAPAADAPAPVAAPDAGLSTAATDTQSSETPETAASLAVESSGAPALASRPGELPPEILIDRRLVRVDRLLARDDHRAAHEVMNEVLALQREHEVALPAEFPFKYAQVAFAAGLPETAVASLNDYLLAAGREGEFYRDALELLESAEEAVRRADAERRRAEAVRQRAEAERRRVEERQRENADLARRQVEAATVPLPRDPLRSGGLAPEMVTVAAGRFQYFTWQEGQYSRRGHVEWVTFDRPFAIGKYEVTRAEFEIFADRARYRTEARRDPEYGCRAPRQTGARQRNSSFRWDRPGFDQTDRHPVTCVSIGDAMAYARWLSQETGQRYRLPGAAEWQYAARAGSVEAMYYIPLPRDFENRENPDICRYAHVDEYSVDGCSESATDGPDGSTVAVGSLRPSGIGLHDMIGNVDEVVLACGHPSPDADEDDVRWYLSSRYLAPDGAPEDPETCEYYVATKGGAWYHNGVRGELTTYRTGDLLRVTPGARPYPNVTLYYRNSRNFTGFRLVRELLDAGGVQ